MPVTEIFVSIPIPSPNANVARRQSNVTTVVDLISNHSVLSSGRSRKWTSSPFMVASLAQDVDDICQDFNESHCSSPCRHFKYHACFFCLPNKNHIHESYNHYNFLAKKPGNSGKDEDFVFDQSVLLDCRGVVCVWRICVLSVRTRTPFPNRCQIINNISCLTCYRKH